MQKVSEQVQEIPQSHTVVQPTALLSKSHGRLTLTRHQKDNSLLEDLKVLKRSPDLLNFVCFVALRPINSYGHCGMVHLTTLFPGRLTSTSYTYFR